MWYIGLDGNIKMSVSSLSTGVASELKLAKIQVIILVPLTGTSGYMVSSVFVFATLWKVRHTHIWTGTHMLLLFLLCHWLPLWFICNSCASPGLRTHTFCIGRVWQRLHTQGDFPARTSPGRLQAMGLQRVGHDWSDLAHTLAHLQRSHKFRSGDQLVWKRANGSRRGKAKITGKESKIQSQAKIEQLKQGRG